MPKVRLYNTFLGGLRHVAVEAWCRLQQRDSSGSGSRSSSVTTQQWWRGVGSLFDFGISLLVAAWVDLDVGWSVGGTLGVPLSVLG